MNIKIYRIFNRPVHSYLLFVQTTASVGEDDHIFVVQNEASPICDPEPSSSAIPEESSSDPTEESSSEPIEESSSAAPSVELSLTYTRCDGQPGIPAFIQVPLIMTAELLKVTIEGLPDAYCYSRDTGLPVAVQPDESVTILDGYTTCVQCIGTVLGGEGEPPVIPTALGVLPNATELPIDPNKVLYTVASLADMEYYPAVIPGLNMFYRSDSVAMLFRSEQALATTLDVLIDDMVKNAALQDIPNPAFEYFTAEDETIIPPSNDDDDYLFKTI
jgi:hypothetical protein